MPDKRVTELDPIDTVIGSDLVLVIDDPGGTPINKRATVSQLGQALAVGPHAPTHANAGIDPVDVKALAGFPGTATTFLRGDGTFAPPASSMDLEYSGNYTPGTYNDGDIVVAADGIAYMCVKSGVTTPPEPWPGVGLATAVGPPGPQGPQGIQGPPGTSAAIVADASYWVVAAHGTLTNERVMSSLANGYVKSVGGEPSTVAVIPVGEGGTGATDIGTARSNLGIGNVGTLNLPGGASTFLRGDGAWVAPPNDIFPSGLMVLSLTPCPPGWTRMVWDGNFLRIGPTPGTSGGAWTHAHGVGTYATPDHLHGAGSLATVDHLHAAGGLAVASHAHSNGNLRVNSHSHTGSVSVSVNVSGGTSNDGAHEHNFNRNFSGQTGGGTGNAMGVDAGGSGDCNKPGHVHSFDGNVNGDTDNRGGHTHSFSGSGGGSGGFTTDADEPFVGSGATGAAAPGVTGYTGAADRGLGVGGSTGAADRSLALTGGSDAQYHLPPFMDVFLCQKN